MAECRGVLAELLRLQMPMWCLPHATTARRVSCGDGPVGKPRALILFGLMMPVGWLFALTSLSFETAV